MFLQSCPSNEKAEAFTDVLESGDEGTVHIDWLLEYSDDPGYMARLALHKLTVEARKRVENSSLSKREIMRRLGTSPAQLYRLLDPANYKKSMNQLVELLAAVDCEVDLVVRERHETTQPLKRDVHPMNPDGSVTAPVGLSRRRRFDRGL